MTARQYKKVGNVLLTIREIMQSRTSKEDLPGQRLIQKVLRLELEVAKHQKKTKGREKRTGVRCSQ